MAPLTPEQRALLHTLAKIYVWWKTPDEALLRPDEITAQVMNMGDWQDTLALADTMGSDFLRGVLRSAQAGQFDVRSWHFWHYRLGMAQIGKVPPLPERAF